MSPTRIRSVGVCLMALTALAAIVMPTARATGSKPSTYYVQTNLVSDKGQKARAHDRRLVNPWGLAAGPDTPFWVTDAGTGFCTLYDGNGKKQRLVVKIPPVNGSTTASTPTGVVFNGESSDFVGDSFIFATEDGTLSGWSQSDASDAVLRVDNSASLARYEGLAIGTDGSHQFIYAANFFLSAVDVFDAEYNLVTLDGSFTDPSLPAHYAPYGIQNINGNICVAYALRDDWGYPILGAGNGVVSMFTTRGIFIRQLVSNGALNAPWGMAMAPADFGPLSNQLLVGNLGDGAINGFDPSTGAMTGQLIDKTGNPIHVDGLWALQFGNGSNNASTNTLYFAAGTSGYAHGLFGKFALHAPKTK
jgi:uncharacterized protein (TIGR03118 family)